jgi:transcriptional regulator with XRE-family HTH domain
MAIGVQALQIRDLRSRLGLSQESLSRALDVSTRSVERWEAKGATTDHTETIRRVSLLEEISRLADEVYGPAVESFMQTPRRSLEMRTPKEALVRGDFEAVRQTLIRALEGDWA